MKHFTKNIQTSLLMSSTKDMLSRYQRVSWNALMERFGIPIYHGVYHPQKGNLRLVFDCGAEFKGVLLNNELLQGPNLPSSLLGVLTRFRQEPMSVVADVQ